MSDTEQGEVDSKDMENKEVEEDERTEQSSSSVAETRRTEKEEAKDLIGQIMEMVTSSVADSNQDTNSKDQANQEEDVAGKDNQEKEEEKAGGEEDKQPEVSSDNQPASDNDERGDDNTQNQEEGKEDTEVEDEGKEEPEPPQTDTEVAANGDDKDTHVEQPPVTTTATETKEEEEITVEEVVKEIITPHLLTDEEIIGKGVAESDIEMYRKFHLKLSYSPKKWYDIVKNVTFTTEFIVLSPEEISALLTAHHSPNEDAPEVSDEVKGVLGELQAKLDSTISQFEEGAFIKLCGHSIRDAILDKCDTDHVQAVEDGLQNELEIEQQFVNAYLNWRSWRSMSYRENTRTKLPSEQPTRGNVVRRSIRRIRKSFSRPHSASGVDENDKEVANDDKKDDSPLAEENVKNDENADEEDETKATQDPENAEDKEIETNEESSETNDVPVAAVTVEATVEKTSTAEDKNADEGEESKEDTTSPQETSPKEGEQTTTDEDEEDVKVKSKPVEDEPQEDKPEIEEVTSTDKSVKEDKQDTDATGEEIKQKRVPPPMLAGKEQAFVKVKSETKGNKVLRAFIKATNAMYRITSGEQAIELLLTSRVIKEDLEQAKVFANISGVEAVLSVQRWHADVAKYPGMQFRMFVYKNKLTGLSQKDDVAYIPNIVRYKSTIQSKTLQFFNSTLKNSFDDLESYVVDIFVGTTKTYVVDLYPFYTGTGACLFTWQQNKTALLNGPLEFRHISTPFKNCFTGLQPHWQQICSAALQKKKREAQQSGKCVLL